MTISASRIRILLADDHPLLRHGVAGLVADQPDMELVGEASSGREAVDQFRKHLPDVALVDLQMPEMNGIDAILAIRAEFPNARIIVLTTYTGDAQVLRALKAGAQAYLVKSALRRELLDTIRVVYKGQRWITPEIAQQIAEHAADDALSDRELAILRGVAHGSSNKIIASNLNISEQTVKNHLKSILSKLDANDRTHAVTIALKRGIIQL